MSIPAPSPLPQLARWLYVSRVAAGVPPAAISQILRHSRERNRETGIGGALLFDGECFAQLLEGAPGPTLSLAERITADRRHCELQVLFHSTVADAPLLPFWRTGYCEPGLLTALPPGGAGTSPDPMLAFLRLLDRADLSP